QRPFPLPLHRPRHEPTTSQRGPASRPHTLPRRSLNIGRPKTKPRPLVAVLMIDSITHPAAVSSVFPAARARMSLFSRADELVLFLFGDDLFLDARRHLLV